MKFSDKWMELGKQQQQILSEVTQTQTDTHGKYSLISRHHATIYKLREAK